MRHFKSIALAALIGGFGPVAIAEDASTEAAAELQLVEAKVSGMTCEMCAQAVIHEFRNEDSVVDVAVDLEAGTVILTLVDGGDILDTRIAEVVDAAGYELVEVVRADA